MWRLLTVLATASVGGFGCGAADRVKPIDFRGCPSGKDVVTAKDVIGSPPQGYEVVGGDKRRLRQIANQFKATLGDSWRGYDARVLVRRKRITGAAVFVINRDDRTSGNDELIKGAERGARESGQTAESLDIAGQEGRMVRAPDGAYIAMAPTDRCAVVVVIADTAPLVRDAAAKLPTP
jgi:hypothetical protein